MTAPANTPTHSVSKRRPLRPPKSDAVARVEGWAQIVIVLVVGLAAGAASFTHVHDWTQHNSPEGTPDWFGWANAVISELVPAASLLEIRRRRRKRQAVSYPMFLLTAAVVLSLSAQLAVAKPGISGGLLSAVPALAFMGLSKMVLGGRSLPPEPKPVHVPVQAPQPKVVPATADSLAKQEAERPKSEVQRKKRRTTEETLALLLQLQQEKPDLTRKEQAATLGISPRRIRMVLQEAEPAAA